MTEKADKAYWRDRWIDSHLPPNRFATGAYRRMRGKGYTTLLDIGCGDGRDAMYFADRGLRVTAVDYSDSGIKNLKSKRPDIRSVRSDIRKMKFPNRSFDVIYAHLSLHYFNDRETANMFANLHRMLKKRGLLVIKVKSTDDALYGKGKKIGEDTFKEGHTRHFFSREYMKNKLERFEIIQIRKTSSVYSNYKSSFIEAFATT